MAKLKLSMGVIKAALDHSLNGVCIVQKVRTSNGEAKRIVFINAAFSDLTGYSRAELLGKSPDCFTTEQIHFELGGENSSIIVEGSLNRKDSSVSPTCQVQAKFTHFVAEEQHYVMASFQDLTELSQFQKQQKTLVARQDILCEAMGKTATRLAAIMEFVPDVVWECDMNFCYTYVSDTSEKILGYPPESLLGQPVYSYMDEEYQQFFREAFPPGEELKSLHRISVPFSRPDGKKIILEVSSNPIHLDDNHWGQLGITRDKTTLLELEENTKELAEGMTIKVDDQCRLFFASAGVLPFLTEDPTAQEIGPDFLQYLVDPSTQTLVSFAFDQQEDVPFPVEIQLKDAEGNTNNFNVELHYNSEESCLEGQLIPTGAKDQLAVMTQKMEDQKESMANVAAMDPEMQQTVIADSQGLTAEILSLIKSLEPYGYPQEDEFDIKEYAQFIEDKNVLEYRENIRLLGNKIHGLKGTSGFLISASKQLCHHIEELTRPLAENKLVLTLSTVRLLKQFIFRIQDMLEQYQKNANTSFDIEDWLTRIDETLEKGWSYLGEQTGDFLTLLVKQSSNIQENQKRPVDDYMSVSQQGYEVLSEQVQNLFYMVSESLTEDSLVKAGGLYNEFLDTHQTIIKVPPDLSRYERLIPSWAQEYGKEAEFVFKDHGVRADREFWNALHEIFNHSLKNAVIHGIELPEEREEREKDRCGKVTVGIQEDALHSYVQIADDGQGIDIDKVKQKAVENRIITPEQLQNMTKEEILSLVFVQGVSTAETLDDNAGRGVGMNAVQEAMRQFQGKCVISSELGQGTSWSFIFPKSNVSLPCFIVTIGDFRIAIPENHVEAFYGHRAQHIRQINQKTVFRRMDEIIPLLDSQNLFDEAVCVDADRIRRILILQIEQEKAGIVINDIIHHATMPILPLPEEYRQVPIYLGATLFGNHSVLVLNANQVFN